MISISHVIASAHKRAPQTIEKVGRSPGGNLWWCNSHLRHVRKDGLERACQRTKELANISFICEKHYLVGVLAAAEGCLTRREGGAALDEV